MVNVFVYGTLMFPEIVFSLTHKKFKTENATLNNYKRFKIHDGNHSREYPAISKSEGDFVDGVLLFDVDEDSLKILDFFEDDEYIRKEMTVSFNNQSCLAFVYIWNPKSKDKLKSSWNSDEFKEKYLNYYVFEVIPDILRQYNSN